MHFFSCISDGQGNVRYFDHNQRRNKVILKNGGLPNYDSHTSIATFYGLKGMKEDVWNKWEYNPFSNKLKLDQQNTADDRDDVLAKLHAINWDDFCGDIESVKKLLVQIPTIPWFQNNGQIPKGVKLFETRNAARDATGDATLNAVRNAAWNADRNAAWNADRNAALDAALDVIDHSIWDAALDVIDDSIWDATRNTTLLAFLHICNGLDIDPKHMEFAMLCWRVWEAGYGVFGDVDGVIYAYKKP